MESPTWSAQAPTAHGHGSRDGAFDLAGVRDRALQAAGIATLILDPGPDVPTIVWANESFAQLTGYPAGDVVGLPLTLLEAPGRAGFDFTSIRDELIRDDEAPLTWRMLNARADGGLAWCEYCVAQVRDDDDVARHWVAMVTDVSQQVVEHDEQERSIEVERAARTTLDLVSLVSDLLTDLDYPYVLREVAQHLQHGVVGWAGFYLNDNGLVFSEGINVSVTSSVASNRLAREAGVSVDALGDSRTPGDSTGLTQVIAPVVDPLQDLLEGLVSGPIGFALRTDYPEATAARVLATELRVRMGVSRAGGEDGWPVVVVHAVPGRRRVLGLLVTTPNDPVFDGIADVDATTMTLLHVVARRVGMAIDNVRLYAREHQLAETLQRAMLPEQVDIAGLDVWTYYAPTSDHAQVGGDWYDVLQIDDEVAGLVIGDVVGHDIEAAATMGQLRSVVRSYAFELTTPGLVLERVDQLVVGMRIPRSASLVYGTLRRVVPVDPGVPEESGRWRLEYSRAGHLPPLLVRAGKASQLSGAGGALIGFGTRARGTAAEILEPGDALIFYTDGLIERRDRALRAGLAALIDAAEHSTATDAAGIGEELLARLADAPEDDVAVVVVRVPNPVADGAPPAMSPRSRRWLLPSEPASIGRARHAVLRTCQAWDLADVANAELVVSELVANAVLHGWGHIALRLFDTGDGLRIEVEDSNPAPPVTTDGHANRLGGYGMQIVERLADWGWRPSGTGKLVWAKIRTSQG
ncbi:PAS domain S-box-containing protein [Sanguibacter gelidistatuariae]|uniref:PAS domain S-box-containing protein n=1 Tax=Sanguibacter gelidistatuariae TaxID=1814289 RepID=A0A1G6HD95_9MICO|nr:SpoIIE family protein phosphatase [Sanguibacter gelidistatuariae]SDB92058.1 PAS domain S-box-containing protein [Sanguibacter gelidistatuariae]